MQKTVDVNLDKAVPISPVRRLSSELVLRIVTLASAYEHVDPFTKRSRVWHVSLDVRHGIWVFGRVCRHWRTSIISSPTPWRSIYVSLQGLTVSGAPETLRTVLERSSNLPLVIDMGDNPREEPWTGAAFDRREKQRKIVKSLTKMLVARCHLWRDARLDIPDEDFASLFSPIRNRLPLLESLHIVGCDSLFGKYLKNYFAVAPLLRKVTLYSMNFSSDFKLPWSQITHYHDWDFFSDPEHENKKLRRMPNIVHFAVSTPSAVGDLDDSPNPIRLDHLRSFAGGVLDQFVAPSLEKLTLSNGVFSMLPLLIRRSACSLSSLTIQGLYDLTVDEFTSVAATLSTVTHLSLGFNRFHSKAVYSARFISGLTCHVPEGEGSRILPNLLELAIGGLLLTGITLETMADVVESRLPDSNANAVVARLRSFSLTGTVSGVEKAQSFDPFSARLAVLQKRGMDIKLDVKDDVVHHGSLYALAGR